jgi:hypothetical protein
MLGYPDTADGRRRMVEALDERARAEGVQSGIPQKTGGLDGRLSDLRRGWYWGRQEFAEKMLKMSEALGRKRRSRAFLRTPEVLEHGELKALEILEAGLEREGLQKADLPGLRANDSRKVAIAREIWQQTTVSQSWISERLAMKNAANVSLALHRGKGREK